MWPVVFLFFFSLSLCNTPIEITRDNFHLVFKGKWLLELYSPRCGHCKRFEPIFEKLGIALHGSASLGKINVLEQPELHTLFGIDAVPAIFTVDHGFYRELPDRQRSYSDILAFAQNKEGEVGQKLPTLEEEGFIEEEQEEEQLEEQALDEQDEVDTEVSEEELKAIYELDAATFDDQISSGDWFIEIYAPWCSHCTTTLKQVALLASTLADRDIKVGRVDASEHPELLDRLRVIGYPSYRFIRNREEYYFYTGPHLYENFLAFVNGEYQYFQKRELPPVNIWQLRVTALVDVYKQWFRFHVFTATGLLAAFFFGLGFVLGQVFSAPTKKTTTKEKTN